MDTSSFQRLPESIQKLVTDGLDLEVQAGLEQLEKAKKSGSLSNSETTAIEADMRKAAELRSKYSPAE